MADKESILVVDDDLGFLEVIERILHIKGFDVDVAPSAGEAVSKSKQRFYNAAILDISLPDANGTELLSMLLEIHPDIIAIMLTGYSSAQNAIDSVNRGAFAYLEKPLDPENLLSVIKRGLEKQRLVLENRRLMDELEQRNRNTSILLEVSQAVAKSLDLQQIIDSALERVVEAMDVEASYVHLLEDNKLVLKGCCGFAPQAVEGLGKAVEDGVIGRVFNQVEPIVIKRIDAVAETSLAPLAEGGYRSYAGAPLAIVGECIGVIGVASRRERLLTPRDVELLMAIGREISIAVKNSQLYEEASSVKALKELDAMRTEFLANVSHELRTPLAVIKGSANSLLQPDVDFDEQAWRDFLLSIDNDADRLTRLVEDLLTMSRLESGALEVRKEPCDLAEVVESAKGRLGKLASKHSLIVDLLAGMPPVVVDEVRIGEVLTNLVENAVKYSAEGTRISIGANPNGKEVVISVTDEGMGIPAELREKVFDRFYQVQDHRKEKRNGTGLGLAICRGIIEAHGGRIWVESEEGRGAKFCFSLPTNGGGNHE